MRIRLVGRHAAAISIALRSGAIAASVVLTALMLLFAIDVGSRFFGAASTPKLPKLHSAAGQPDSSVGNSAAPAGIRDRQTIQIKALEVENGKLLEDLVDFASQLPSAKVEGALALHRAVAGRDAAGRLQYRLLLTQGGKAALTGSLQLTLTGEQGGKPVTLVFPQPDATAAELAAYAVRPGRLQRFEGALAVPQDVTVKTLTARVLEKGQLRIQQPVALRSAYHVRS